MGKAAKTKQEQLKYLRQRTHLFKTAVELIDPNSATPDDLDNVLKVIKDIELKVERFKKDWEIKEPKDG